MSQRSFWAVKVRQFRAYVKAGVDPAEREALVGRLTESQLALFDGMHVADRRHGLDVMATLRGDGVTDPEILLAGLLHDAAKGDTGVGPRVAFSLGQQYGTWIWVLAGRLPGWSVAIDRLRLHAARSADLAEAAGCPARTVELIRWQHEPRDPVGGELLRLADEAN
jgi:hypothetical protein